jgi:hypothetical protein
MLCLAVSRSSCAEIVWLGADGGGIASLGHGCVCFSSGLGRGECGGSHEFWTELDDGGAGFRVHPND